MATLLEKIVPTAPARRDSGSPRGPWLLRGLRAGIWAALLLVVMTAFGSLPAQSVHPAQGVAATATAEQELGFAPLAAGPSKIEGAGRTPVAGPDLCASGSPLKKYATDYCETGTEVTDAESPLELLPAYRWRDDVQLTTDYGITDVALGSPFMNSIAEGLFGMASMCWMVLIQLTRFGLTMNLVADSAAEINRMFESLSLGIWDSGIIAIIFLVAIVAAIKALLSGNLPRTVGLILLFALPIGGLQVLASNAGDPANGGTPPKGSPAWIAVEGTSVVNDIGVNIATGFGTAATVSSTGDLATTTTGTTASCDYYRAQLYAAYAKAASGDPSNSASLWGKKATVSNQLTASTAVSTVSYLWEKSFMDNWVSAQFGNHEEGSFIACHRLEENGNVAPAEQMAIAAPTQAGSPYAGFKVGAFIPLSGDKEGQAAMFAWAACADDNGKTARPGWKQAGGIEGSGEADGTCDKWRGWNGESAFDVHRQHAFAADSEGGADGALQFGDMDDLNRATTQVDTGASDEELTRVRETVSAYWGHNSGERMLLGLLSLITAGIYLWALGALAIGAIIAGVALVVMLVCLPVTLIMFALPGQGAGGRNPAGIRMLRLTGAFLAAKLIFVFVLTLLLVLIDLLHTFVGTDGGSIRSALIPLAALFALRALLKGIGFGDITKLGGALSMSSAGAAQLAGDKAAAGAFGRSISKATPGAIAGNAMGKLRKTQKNVDAAKRLGLGAAKVGKRGGMIAGKVAKGGAFVGRGIGREGAHQMGKSRLGARILEKSQSNSATRSVSSVKQRMTGYVDPTTGTKLSDGALSRIQSMAGIAAFGERHKRIGAGARMAARFLDLPPSDIARAEAARQQHQRMRGLALQLAQEKDPSNRQLMRDEFWIAQHHQLAKLMQTREGGGTPLGPMEIPEAKARKAEQVGADVSQIVLGAAGTAPLVVPPVTVDGKVIPRLASDDHTIRNAGNMLNFVDKDWVQRWAGEDEAHHHMRLVLGMQALGGYDDQGRQTSVLAAHGIDETSAAGRLEILKAAYGEPSALNNISYSLSQDVRTAILSAISAAGIPQRETGSSNEAVRAREAHQEVIYEKASAYDGKLNDDLRHFGDLVQKLGAGVGPADAAEITQEIGKLVEAFGGPLRELHSAAVEIKSAAAMNARPGDEARVAQEAMRALEGLQDGFGDLELSLAAQFEALKRAAPGQQAALAADLYRSLQRYQEEASSNLVDAVDKALEERDRHMGQLAMSGQPRQVPRGEWFGPAVRPLVLTN